MKPKYEWVGSREKDNFSYTRGIHVSYPLNCKNSLVFSEDSIGYLEGKSNYAIIKLKGKKKFIPISKIEEILNEISPFLLGKKIFYKKPSSIYERENLNAKCIEDLGTEIIKYYGIGIKEISEIKNFKGNTRIYKITSKDNERFILKYRGKSTQFFEAQKIFLDGVSYFPKIILTTDSNSSINVNGEAYALEEFLEGGRFSGPKQKYFGLVGKHIALIHNQINNILNKNRFLEDLLFQEGDFFSESNLISMRIDLMNESKEKDVLLEETDSLLCGKLSERLTHLPYQIIHGDLNKSNLIWKGEAIKIIDSEELRFSKRVREFIPILLFKGNLQNPTYTPNSIKKLLFSYDLFSKNKLSKKEKEILPDLLRASLIKLYAIYTIRKNKRNDPFRNNIIRNLKNIEGDLNVH